MYMECLECYFVAVDVVNIKKQRAILLSCCGATMAVFWVWQHQASLWLFKFNSRSQQPGESIAAYVSELRKLSEFCEYGESLDDMLCDHLMCGLAEQWVQQCLLAEGDLTFDRAMKITQAM